MREIWGDMVEIWWRYGGDMAPAWPAAAALARLPFAGCLPALLPRLRGRVAARVLIRVGIRIRVRVRVRAMRYLGLGVWVRPRAARLLYGDRFLHGDPVELRLLIELVRDPLGYIVRRVLHLVGVGV